MVLRCLQRIMPFGPDTLAKECEARGFESIWFPEHTHIPASRKSPFPGGGELPREYWHTHDLFVTLGVAAAVTSTIKIGSGICLVIERDPITMANEVATVDQLSNGRLLFGIAAAAGTRGNGKPRHAV